MSGQHRKLKHLHQARAVDCHILRRQCTEGVDVLVWEMRKNVHPFTCSVLPSSSYNACKQCTDSSVPPDDLEDSESRHSEMQKNKMFAHLTEKKCHIHGIQVESVKPGMTYIYFQSFYRLFCASSDAKCWKKRRSHIRERRWSVTGS